MIFDRILAAVDGTDVSLRGVKVAAEMVARYHSELILLTVVSVPQQLVLSATMDQRTIGSYIERLAQGSLATSMEALREAGVGAEVKAVVGPPAETILAEIEIQPGRPRGHGPPQPLRAEGPDPRQRELPRLAARARAHSPRALRAASPPHPVTRMRPRLHLLRYSCSG